MQNSSVINLILKVITCESVILFHFHRIWCGDFMCFIFNGYGIKPWKISLLRKDPRMEL